MAGLFIVLLLVVVAKYWWVLAGALALWLSWSLVFAPWWQRQVEQTQGRQRHERARIEIDAAARATTRAMADAAREWRA